MEVDRLIGSDWYWHLVTGDVRRGTSGPTSIHTELACVLSGSTEAVEQGQPAVNLLATHTLRIDSQQGDMMSFNHRLRTFWKLESLGIQDSE